jgi:hypothetical protein
MKSSLLLLDFLVVFNLILVVIAFFLIVLF